MYREPSNPNMGLALAARLASRRHVWCSHADPRGAEEKTWDPMPDTPDSHESLFSYGTLQFESVQLATFGRKLSGTADALVGFEQSMVRIEDPSVVQTSGKTHHPIVKFTGNASDEVAGTVFSITVQELLNADKYEVAAYLRVGATLKSGVAAWVYVDARFAPGGPR
jgi:hypothetical protein